MSATVSTNEETTEAVDDDAVPVAADSRPAVPSRQAVPAGRNPLAGPVGNTIAVAVFALSGAALFWMIHHYAVDIIYYDQWTDINVIQHAHDGTLTLGTLWAQHNENRILFPNLVVLALAGTSHYDVIVEDILSGILWAVTAALVIATHKRRSPGVPLLYYCPVALVLLSFVPATDALFGFNLSWFMVTAALGATLYLLDRPALTRLALAGAVVAAVVGSYSSLQGLLIWPAGVVLLLLRHRTRRVVTGWIGTAVVVIVVYFVGFNFAATGGSGGSPLAHPLTSIEFFFSLVGNVFGANLNSTPNAVNGGPLALGIVICLIAAWGVVRTLRSDRPAGRPVGVALICFGLVFAVSTTVGRMQFGLPSTGRYSIFTLTIWVGAYLSLLGSPTPWSEGMRGLVLARMDRILGVTGRYDDAVPESGRPARPGRPVVVTWLAQMVLVVLLVAQLISSTGQGLLFARAWHDQEVTMAEVESNIGQAPDSLVLATLGGYETSFVRPLARFARAQQLGLYGSGLYRQDRRTGLPPGLVTSIASPADGAVLSGAVVMGCQAYVYSKRDVVQFRLSGSGLHGTVVAIAHAFEYGGFLARWDTTTVPDGQYRLRTAVVRPGLPTLYSPAMSVTVENHPSASG